jgi:hypothetical protein
MRGHLPEYRPSPAALYLADRLATAKPAPRDHDPELDLPRHG